MLIWRSFGWWHIVHHDVLGDWWSGDLLSTTTYCPETFCSSTHFCMYASEFDMPHVLLDDSASESLYQTIRLPTYSVCFTVCVSQSYAFIPQFYMWALSDAGFRIFGTSQTHDECADAILQPSIVRYRMQNGWCVSCVDMLENHRPPVGVRKIYHPPHPIPASALSLFYYPYHNCFFFVT